MQVPVKLSFHGCDHSDALESEIQGRLAKIENHYGRLTSCRIVVELPHKSHAQGKLFHVNIDMSIPGAGHVLYNEKGQDPAHEDVHIAVRDAFNAIESQVKKVVGKRRDVARKISS
ncbi:MAG: ribosome-associated translation inhibitor RaiA [Magnetovibrio sp.]|nr:ribosome-associated translation inhibitor RaiA [Magnetovibrio sp.]